ncbi:hypothetical protein PoB_002701300 [Plakobranchus ocellatus]|uniref:Uncharacterized protein n=1 Tax=Plakobranchus ocellatus TaxID=259542 RepID=A0AAV4A1L5_9GAST|nr:hypothetical protein PoB_002701300 [Plakobranchus ocellatus]
MDALEGHRITLSITRTAEFPNLGFADDIDGLDGEGDLPVWCLERLHIISKPYRIKTSAELNQKDNKEYQRHHRRDSSQRAHIVNSIHFQIFRGPSATMRASCQKSWLE